MESNVRSDGRKPNQIRKTRIYPGVLRHPAGSALVQMGHTQVLCSASVEETLPGWLRGQGRGWVTAEYGMLPGSVDNRAPRHKVSGRSQEIQRLIGRSLRSVVDLHKLGERSITVDCDVVDADGGTRTAAITAAYVALRRAFDRLRDEGHLKEDPMTDSVAAVSVGMVAGEFLLDLCYQEDARADVDFNVVATGSGTLVEVQGTAEGKAFSAQDSQKLIRLALRGIEKLRRVQEKGLAAPARVRGLI